MATNVELQDDAGEPVASFNYGTAQDGLPIIRKHFVKNTGTIAATDISIILARLLSNDGSDFVIFAEDDGSGNPDTFNKTTINVGTLQPMESYPFWVKIQAGNGVSPEGNPRQFRVRVPYRGI